MSAWKFIVCLLTITLINSCGTGFCGFGGCGDNGSGGSGDDGGSGGGGSAIFSTGTGFNARVHAVAVASDGTGDIYVAGEFTSYNGTAVNKFVRLNDDGSLDTNFVGEAIVGDIFALSIDPVQNDIYVGGNFSNYQALAADNIVRVESDGGRDGGFSVFGFNSSVFSIAVDTLGDIVYAGGFFTSYGGTATAGVTALHTDGSQTAFFAGTANAGVRSLTLPDAGRRVYIGGQFSTYATKEILSIARVNSDGSLDSDFTDLAEGFNGSVESVVIAQDGSFDIYVGGNFTNYTKGGSATTNNAARLITDGSLDNDYPQSPTGPNAAVDVILALSDGDTYVAGVFDSYKATAASRIVRLNSDALIDTGFIYGTGFNGSIEAMAIRPNSTDVYIAGNFTTYNGRSAARLIRLNSDGTID